MSAVRVRGVIEFDSRLNTGDAAAEDEVNVAFAKEFSVPCPPLRLAAVQNISKSWLGEYRQAMDLGSWME